MNFTQAHAAMKKLLGAKAGWRYDEKAAKAEERAALIESLPDLRAVKDAANAAMEARRAELLKDPEFQRLRQEYQDAKRAIDNACSRASHYRVMIGRHQSMFFEILVQADNWQDAIDKLKEWRARGGQT